MHHAHVDDQPECCHDIVGHDLLDVLDLFQRNFGVQKSKTKAPVFKLDLVSYNKPRSANDKVVLPATIK